MAGKEKYTAQQVIQALQETKGMVYLAAKRLKCHHETVYRYMDRHPSIKAAWEAQSGEALDVGELKLYEAVMRGEAWAVTFFLKTKGRHRGYVERQEHTGAEGGPVRIAADLEGKSLEELEALADAYYARRTRRTNATSSRSGRRGVSGR